MTLYKLENNKLLPFSPTKLKTKGHTEEDLESWIERNPHVLSEEDDIAIIGRQYTAQFGTGDLLALDSDGNLVVVELKGKKTPRETLAQALEYGAWARKLSVDDLKSIYEAYIQTTQDKTDFFSLVSALNESKDTLTKADIEDSGIASKEKQRVMIVAEEISPRIVEVAEYLGEKGLDIECRSVKLYVVRDDEFIETETVYRSRKPAKERESGLNRLRNAVTPSVRETLDGLRRGLLDMGPFVERLRTRYLGYRIRVGERFSTLVGLFPLMHPDKPGLYVFIYKHPLRKMGRYDDFLQIISRNLKKSPEELLTKSEEFHVDASGSDVDPIIESIRELLDLSELSAE